jgi:hypothetical protein
MDRAEPQMEEGQKVTRTHLLRWGFRRLPDVWLPCHSECRYKYFERWYHASWNYTAVIGWPSRDPLELTRDDFVSRVQAHIFEDEVLLDQFDWEEVVD